MLEYNIDLSGKSILVTGAAGFIGSNLSKRLLSDFEGIKVIGIDSITDYYDVNLKYERLHEIENLSKDRTFIKGPSTPLREGLRKFAEWYRTEE